MRKFFTTICLTLALYCCGQIHFDKTKISRQTEQVVTKIEKTNELMGSAVYAAGIRPAQYNNFTELQDKATQDELVALTDHPNGVVRCYAFWALTCLPSVKLLPIIIAHINDTALVNTQFGCIGGKEMVGDFFITIATAQNVDLNSNKLTTADHDYLDSVLIFTPNKLYAKEIAISRAKPNETLYKKTRELVLKENNQTALVTLAKFKREQDIPLILNNIQNGEHHNKLFYTYKAISEFPDNTFLPLLKNSLNEAVSKGSWSTEWRELYRAIACFKNDTALQLLKLPFTQTKNENIRPYHINFIFGAIQDFYIPMYDELLWQMWENDKKINAQVFNLLYSKNQDKAFQLIKKTIQNADDFYYLNTDGYSEDGSTPLNLLDVMLDTLLARDRQLAIEFINKNIREINVHQFPTFADKALNIKDSSLIESLFDRLETEDNPHIYLKATEVLIAFKNGEINKRIVEVSATNPALKKDWGGKAFRELLKDSGIM